MKQNRVFLFCSGIDDVLNDLPKVAGIQVQMSFWAKTFGKYGWDVYSFSQTGNSHAIEDIQFVKLFSSSLLSIIHLQSLVEWINCWKCILRKPDLVITRGAQRYLYLLSILCKIWKIKLVYFGASDVNFIPGKEQIAGSKHNRHLYQKAIQSMEYVVTQNQAQHDALKRNYRKESLIMPNIWIPSEQKKHEKEYDAIWVSNLRPLKRAEWFLEVANRHPQFRFCIVGGYLDKDYYSSIQQKSQEIPNLSFLGAKSFEEVNTLIAKSRLLVCTSEYEGFPNTFLQAWAQSVPVVSTVNPNNVFENHKLGVYVENVDSLCENTCTLLMDVQLYNDYMICIQNYFTENHSAVNGFVRLMNYMGFPN